MNQLPIDADELGSGFLAPLVTSAVKATLATSTHEQVILGATEATAAGDLRGCWSDSI
jgi:hypothetical protein